MIKLKANVFGTKYLRLNVFLYLVFTLLWTASISIRENNSHGWTYKVALIVVLTIFGQMVSFHFIWKVRNRLSLEIYSSCYLVFVIISRSHLGLTFTY